MADAKTIKGAITHTAVETAKATVQTMTLAGGEAGTGQRSMAMSKGPKPGGPFLKQPSFDWCVRDKYTNVTNFQIEVNNIFMTYNRSTNDAEKVLMVLTRQR